MHVFEADFRGTCNVWLEQTCNIGGKIHVQTFTNNYNGVSFFVSMFYFMKHDPRTWCQRYLKHHFSLPTTWTKTGHVKSAESGTENTLRHKKLTFYPLFSPKMHQICDILLFGLKPNDRSNQDSSSFRQDHCLQVTAFFKLSSTSYQAIRQDGKRLLDAGMAGVFHPQRVLSIHTENKS